MISEASTNILFRPCIQSDLPTIQQMADQLYAEDWNTHAVQTDVSLTYQELSLKPDKGRLITIEFDGEIAGYCIIIFFWSNEYRGNIIEVDELFIVESHRASGIATVLLKWLKRNFAENLSGFSMQVAQSNIPMLRFSKKNGFSNARYLHLFKILNHEGPEPTK